MREIIFRGKDKEGVWHHGYLVKSKTAFDDKQHVIISIENYFQLSSTPSGSLCFLESKNRVNKVIPETIGQFTGLTDKNGVKIFEGDVVEDLGGNKGIIRYDTENASFDIEFDTEYSSMNDVNSFATVIGNIHDNPELL